MKPNSGEKKAAPNKKAAKNKKAEKFQDELKKLTAAVQKARDKWEYHKHRVQALPLSKGATSFGGIEYAATLQERMEQNYFLWLWKRAFLAAKRRKRRVMLFAFGKKKNQAATAKAPGEVVPSPVSSDPSLKFHHSPTASFQKAAQHKKKKKKIGNTFGYSQKELLQKKLSQLAEDS